MIKKKVIFFQIILSILKLGHIFKKTLLLDLDNTLVNSVSLKDNPEMILSIKSRKKDKNVLDFSFFI